MLSVTAAEQRQLTRWNATRQDYPPRPCIPELIASQARAVPEALALAMASQVLTYQELNQSANRMAHHLQKLGVGPETLVAVCLERSPSLVVSLLAVLKAGGAYLPLDPSYPAERLSYMLADAQPLALVTRTQLCAPLRTGGAHVVRLDADARKLARQSASDPQVAVSPAHLAYVIYTSGSTGQPKGVEIPHSSLSNLVHWHCGAFQITAADRATQLASPSFDAIGWEIWPYLTRGASIHLPDDDTRSNPAALRDWIVERNVTIAFLPTPLAEAAIGLDWPAKPALRLMLTGGDTLHLAPPPQLPFTLINNYGPTEGTVVATSGPVPPATLPENPERRPSIGRPIANTQIHVLDELLRPVPVGTAGQLFIGGAGVARGYLNRPELTAERFIANPLGEPAGGRLYQTGDLARYLPDGQIEFLGRDDDQLEIRGYRIEPEEIAATLCLHPAIQASCVVAREHATRDDATRDKHLVAYVVTMPGAPLPLNALRDSLAARLPAYMIPSVFVRLDRLPVTPNGKVDRAALPAPDATNLVSAEAVRAPTTPLEQRLVTMVAATLDLAPHQVGIDDDFFLLGGHSMLGTQLIALVADAFGVELALRTLFAGPTIRELAAEITRLLMARVASISDEEVERLLR
ncbi:MAG TPA: non-ribosomal peptide synthetase [Ktedonobacterales bacterium]|nr:non-ribosomal peptide synthetase [Ktedonobacterales bacterium]